MFMSLWEEKINIFFTDYVLYKQKGGRNTWR